MSIDLTAASFALLFPGQGTQYVGMGRHTLIAAAARPSVATISSIAGVDIEKVSSAGPSSELDRTSVTQPCVFAASLAAVEVLRDHLGGFGNLVACAGHSLGHFAALVTAGALELGDAAALVTRRGHLMEEAGSENPGAMAAVGLGADEVSCQLASHDEVWLANVNAPDQVVISGRTDAVRAFIDELAPTVKRSLLPVGVAAHSPFMAGVAGRFAQDIAKVKIVPPTTAVYLNSTGAHTTSPDEIRQDLADQMRSTVDWQATLAALGRVAEVFVDTGPAQAMARLVGRNGLDQPTVAIGFMEPVAKLVQRQ